MDAPAAPPPLPVSLGITSPEVVLEARPPPAIRPAWPVMDPRPSKTRSVTPPHSLIPFFVRPTTVFDLYNEKKTNVYVCPFVIPVYSFSIPTPSSIHATNRTGWSEFVQDGDDVHRNQVRADTRDYLFQSCLRGLRHSSCMHCRPGAVGHLFRWSVIFARQQPRLPGLRHGVVPGPGGVQRPCSVFAYIF